MNTKKRTKKHTKKPATLAEFFGGRFEKGEGRAANVVDITSAYPQREFYTLFFSPKP